MEKTMVLPCELTDAERRAMGERLAAVVCEIADVRDEAKVVQKDFAGRVGRLEKDRGRIARTVTRGWEEREVEVYEVRNKTVAVVDTIRRDTGAVVKSRTMTEAELQTDFFLDDLDRLAPRPDVEEKAPEPEKDSPGASEAEGAA